VKKRCPPGSKTERSWKKPFVLLLRHTFKKLGSLFWRPRCRRAEICVLHPEVLPHADHTRFPAVTLRAAHRWAKCRPVPALGLDTAERCLDSAPMRPVGPGGILTGCSLASPFPLSSFGRGSSPKLLFLTLLSK